jgi:hypothetical protein
VLSAADTANPPADIDAAIVEGERRAEAMRAELPRWADHVCAAVAEYASAWWEQETRRVIGENPERATENAARFPQLKAELRELQGAAVEIARRHFAQAFSPDGINARISELVNGPRRERDAVLTVNTLARAWEEPLRYVLGEIGPALHTAGLTSANAMSLDLTTAIDPSGRYRYALEITDEFAAATHVFDDKLRELAGAHAEVAALNREKLRRHATALWDEA